MQEYLKKTRQELRLRNYSIKTIKAYLGYLREYFDFKKFNLEKLDEEKRKQLLSFFCGRYRTRTYDLLGVNEAL